MTKQEFVDLVAEESKLTKRDAGAAVDAVLEVVKKSLAAGKDVTFTGFGKFSVAHRAARTGVNPRTGERLSIAASKVPKFTPGSSLKQAVRY
ncbi:MAG TPA: HU family DNA-binding protein [Gaiellaceae bacterium]